MAGKLVVKQASPRIRDVSRREPAIPIGEVAEAFRARPMHLNMGGDTNPLSLVAVREQLIGRLRSTGGRPALADTDTKMKVPIGTDDLRVVEVIAEKIAPDRPKPSPAQVAGIILHLALRRFSEDDLRAEVERGVRLSEIG